MNGTRFGELERLLRVSTGLFSPAFFVFGLGSFLQKRIKEGLVLLFVGLAVLVYWYFWFHGSVIAFDENSGRETTVSFAAQAVETFLWVGPFFLLWAINNYLLLKNQIGSSPTGNLKMVVMVVGIVLVPLPALIAPLLALRNVLYLREVLGIRIVNWIMGAETEITVMTVAFYAISVVFAMLVLVYAREGDGSLRMGRAQLINFGAGALGVLGTGFLLKGRVLVFLPVVFCGVMLVGLKIWLLTGNFQVGAGAGQESLLVAWLLQIHFVPVAAYVILWLLSMSWFQRLPEKPVRGLPPGAVQSKGVN